MEETTRISSPVIPAALPEPVAPLADDFEATLRQMTPKITDVAQLSQDEINSCRVMLRHLMSLGVTEFQGKGYSVLRSCLGLWALTMETLRKVEIVRTILGLAFEAQDDPEKLRSVFSTHEAEMLLGFPDYGQEALRCILLYGHKIHSISLDAALGATRQYWYPCFEWLVEAGYIGNPHLAQDLGEICTFKGVIETLEIGRKTFRANVCNTAGRLISSREVSPYGESSPDELKAFLALAAKCPRLDTVPLWTWLPLMLSYKDDLRPSLRYFCREAKLLKIAFARALRDAPDLRKTPGWKKGLTTKIYLQERAQRRLVLRLSQVIPLLDEFDFSYSSNEQRRELLNVLKEYRNAYEAWKMYEQAAIKEAISERKIDPRCTAAAYLSSICPRAEEFGRQNLPLMLLLETMIEKPVVIPEGAKVSDEVSLRSKRKAKRAAAEIILPFEEDADELGDIEVISESVRTMPELSAPSRVLEIPPVPTLEQLLAQTRFVGTWSGYGFDIKERLMGIHGADFSSVPSDLDPVGCLQESSDHLLLCLIGLERLAEALKKRDSKAVIMAVQGLHLDLAVALEQLMESHFQRRFHCKSHEHNLKVLLSWVSPTLSDASALAERYRHALFNVRFFHKSTEKARLYSEPNQSLQALTALWNFVNESSGPDDASLEEIVGSVAQDVRTLVGIILGDQCPISQQDFETLLALLKGLSAEKLPVIDPKSWSKPELQVMHESLSRQLEPLKRGQCPAQYDCLAEARHLIRVLDYGYHCWSDDRSALRFCLERDVFLVHMIAEQLYQYRCYREGTGKIDGHDLRAFQYDLGISQEQASKDLVTVDLNIRHHYPHHSGTKIAFARYYRGLMLATYHSVLRFASGRNRGSALEKKQAAALRALDSLVKTL